MSTTLTIWVKRIPLFALLTWVISAVGVTLLGSHNFGGWSLAGFILGLGLIAEAAASFQSRRRIDLLLTIMTLAGTALVFFAIRHEVLN